MTLNDFYLKEREWIEQFYSDFERNSGRKRPIDYKERAFKILTKQRKPIRAQKSGKGWIDYE